MLLSSLGIKINPEDIEAAWMRAKDALPLLAKSFDEMNARHARIEAKLDALFAGKENHDGPQLVNNSVVDIHTALRSDNHHGR